MNRKSIYAHRGRTRWAYIVAAAVLITELLFALPMLAGRLALTPFKTTDRSNGPNRSSQTELTQIWSPLISVSLSQEYDTSAALGTGRDWIFRTGVPFRATFGTARTSDDILTSAGGMFVLSEPHQVSTSSMIFPVRSIIWRRDPWIWAADVLATCIAIRILWAGFSIAAARESTYAWPRPRPLLSLSLFLGILSTLAAASLPILWGADWSEPNVVKVVLSQTGDEGGTVVATCSARQSVGVTRVGVEIQEVPPEEAQGATPLHDLPRAAQITVQHFCNITERHGMAEARGWPLPAFVGYEVHRAGPRGGIALYDWARPVGDGVGSLGTLLLVWKPLLFGFAADCLIWSSMWLVLLGWFPILQTARTRRRFRRNECVRCGYYLLDKTDRCPECGARLEPMECGS